MYTLSIFVLLSYRYHGVWDDFVAILIPEILVEDGRHSRDKNVEELNVHLMAAMFGVFSHWEALVPADESKHNPLVHSLRLHCTALLPKVLDLSTLCLSRFERVVNFFITIGRYHDRDF